MLKHFRCERTCRDVFQRKTVLMVAIGFRRGYRRANSVCRPARLCLARYDGGEGGDAVGPERVGALSLEGGLVDHLVGEDFLSNEHYSVDVVLKERSQKPLLYVSQVLCSFFTMKLKTDREARWSGLWWGTP